MEMDRADLLQLLSYMEAELQARDVTIAALRVGVLCVFVRNSDVCVLPWTVTCLCPSSAFAGHQMAVNKNQRSVCVE